MANFLLEIGTEELPADFVASAIAQWQEKIAPTLEAEYLHPENVSVYGTPRRLAVSIKGIPDRQNDRIEEIKGPPVSAAFKDGQITGAGEGFARKQGVTVEELTVKATDKGDFVFVNKKIPGRLAKEILQELSPQWITSLQGRRFMRWGDGDLRFPRPIRSLIALWDEEVLPLELINGSTTVKSDRYSLGHRVLHPEAVSVSDAGSYVETLRRAYIEVDPQQRREKIVGEIMDVAQSKGAVAEIPEDLLAEVINLVEAPHAVLGKFDEEFLQLPVEVIKTVMVTHQRYFPVKKTESVKSELLPNFITISNGDPHKFQIIADGNARVIRARLADAQFFYKTDCAKSLVDYLPQLSVVTFQEDLGSIADKVKRIVAITRQIDRQLNLSSEEGEINLRTAQLSKADLVTQMVYEFPELQGVMGEKYAQVSGEKEAVARGIFEHYLPRSAEDTLPESLSGQVVGISDRLDTLVSIFGLGMLPTGSSDPFALRRAANAIINIIWSAGLSLNLNQLLEENSRLFTEEHAEKISPFPALQEFFVQRIRTLLQDDLKIDYDLVNAVLKEKDNLSQERALNNLLDIRDRAQFLQKIRDNGQLNQIYETVNRSTRLAVKSDLDRQQLNPKTTINPELFVKDCEEKFYAGLLELLPQTIAAQQQRNYQLLVDSLEKIAPIVSNFFDGPESVLVMDENLDIQRNRLHLLAILRNHGLILADFGEIVKG